jgi:predicted nucleotidyltransferase
VAREAAALLYFGLEKEFRQAKLKAAETLGVHVLPSNLEVALELDRFAEETEGIARGERLVQMRRDALEFMRLLEPFCPLLIGSVWRGNIRRGSDIDIETYHDDAQKVLTHLAARGVKILGAEQMRTTEHGKPISSLHIHVESSCRHPVEIVVRGFEEKGRQRVCDIFGDQIRGLTLSELENLLKTNPAQRFLPK